METIKKEREYKLVTITLGNQKTITIGKRDLDSILKKITENGENSISFVYYQDVRGRDYPGISLNKEEFYEIGKRKRLYINLNPFVKLPIKELF